MFGTSVFELLVFKLLQTFFPRFLIVSSFLTKIFFMERITVSYDTAGSIESATSSFLSSRRKKMHVTVVVGA